MPYTPQVQISPYFTQYMQQRTAPFAQRGGQAAQGLSGGFQGSFGFPFYGNMYGNLMQSGQQPSAGVFGVPSSFSPVMQTQQPAAQAPTTQQPQSTVQQIAGASNYNQPNINLADQGQRQAFMDEYRKLYEDRLYNTDQRYRQLQNDYNRTTLAANTGAPQPRWDDPTRPGTQIQQQTRNWQAAQLERDRARERATAARDAYLNPLWQSQQGTLDQLFSGQLTPAMLLQNMTRGLLG